MRTTLLLAILSIAIWSVADVTPPAARAAGKAVKVEKEWKGSSVEKNDLWKEAPKSGVIAGPKAWAKLWKAWNSDKEAPKVDFQKELILVVAGLGPNIIKVADLKLDDKGDLQFKWSITERGGDGFVYTILKINREGIKTVNRNEIPKESVALAQDKEAEKLLRDMEKKIRAAKSFEITFEYQIEDLAGKKRTTNGTLLLTKDNKARLKVSGYFGGKRDAPFELVSDGKQLKTKGAKFVVASNGMPGVEQGGQSEQETPKNFHAALGALVSRTSIWYCLVAMPYLLRDGIDLDAKWSKVNAYDFKLGAAEKVGERDAKVVRYRFGDGGNDGPEITLWVDGKTLLPLKRVFDLRKNRGVVSGIIITESYNEFTLDPKVDVKAFELPN